MRIVPAQVRHLGGTLLIGVGRAVIAVKRELRIGTRVDANLLQLAACSLCSRPARPSEGWSQPARTAESCRSAPAHQYALRRAHARLSNSCTSRYPRQVDRAARLPLLGHRRNQQRGANMYSSPISARFGSARSRETALAETARHSQVPANPTSSFRASAYSADAGTFQEWARPACRSSTPRCGSASMRAVL